MSEDQLNPSDPLAAHHKPQNLSDRIAFRLTKMLRFCADTFFATSEAQGGVDVIQDFDSTEGDLIALARYGENAEIAAINGMGGGWSNATHSLVDRGDITADGANLQAAMAAEFNAAGSSTTVYRFDYGGKSYLYWDAYGNDYSMGSGDDVVVEITGAVNLSAEHIYLYLEP